MKYKIFIFMAFLFSVESYSQNVPVVDSDLDGIIDNRDKCPKVAGSFLLQGCPEPSKNVIVCKDYLPVNIYFDSSEEILSISDFNRKKMGRIFEILTTFDNMNMILEGYSSFYDKEEENFNLAITRANSVKNYFVNTLGIDSNRIRIKSFGSKLTRHIINKEDNNLVRIML